MPVRVVLHNQLFRSLDHGSCKWQPVKVSDDKLAAGFENTNDFGNRPRSIKPMPALTRCYDIRDATIKTSRFGRRLHVSDLDVTLAIQLLSLVNHPRIRVDSGHFAAPEGERSRQRSRTCPEID